MSDNVRAWVFVSHASKDLRQVRKVRNYLERKGAAPLLFHLRSLADEKEFWPLIEREISARNFFLYCDSEAARASTWVTRERDVIAQVNRTRIVRVGHINVDESVSRDQLDQFLATTRVFPTFSRHDAPKVEPYLQEFERSGFLVFRDSNYDPNYDWIKSATREFEAGKSNGWAVVFITDALLTSPFVQWELNAARSHSWQFVPVLLEPIQRDLPDVLSALNILDLSHTTLPGPAVLRDMLLSKSP